MQTLYFTKSFTKGLLSGLTYQGSISFPTVEACVAWRAAVNAKAARGKLNYKIVDSSFQNYHR